MAEKTLEERLSELYEKIDHRDQFFDKDLKTLIDGIRDAREHGGSSDYTDLSNKPAINGVQLSGDKTPAQLGLATTNQVETLSNKVDKLPTGYYYGKFSSVEDLPEATEKGYAYVASTDPTVFYTYLVRGAGAEWVDSGNKMVNTVDLTTPKTTETELSKGEKYYASANVNDRPADIVDETGAVKALGYRVLNPAMSFAEQVTAANMVFEIKDNFNIGSITNNLNAECSTLIQIATKNLYIDTTPIAIASHEAIILKVGTYLINSTKSEIVHYGKKTSYKVEGTYYIASDSSENITYKKLENIVILPNNCTLKFNGGVISNAIIVGQNVKIDASNVKIFDNVYFDSTITRSMFNVEWFVGEYETGPSQSNPKNSYPELQAMLNSGVEKLKFCDPQRFYHINQTLTINGRIDFYSDFNNVYQEPTGGYARYGCIYSTTIITLLDYNYDDQSMHGGALTLDGLCLWCRKMPTSDQNWLETRYTPIMFFHNTTSVWGADLRVNIIGPGSYEINTSTIGASPSKKAYMLCYTALHIQSQTASIALVKIRGLLTKTYYGLIEDRIDYPIQSYDCSPVSGTTWFTTTEFYADTMCCYGIKSNCGNPITIFGTHQSDKYNINDDAGYFYVQAPSKLIGYVWDGGIQNETTKLWSPRYSVIETGNPVSFYGQGYDTIISENETLTKVTKRSDNLEQFPNIPYTSNFLNTLAVKSFSPGYQNATSGAELSFRVRDVQDSNNISEWKDMFEDNPILNVYNKHNMFGTLKPNIVSRGGECAYMRSKNATNDRLCEFELKVTLNTIYINGSNVADIYILFLNSISNGTITIKNKTYTITSLAASTSKYTFHKEIIGTSPITISWKQIVLKSVNATSLPFIYVPNAIFCFPVLTEKMLQSNIGDTSLDFYRNSNFISSPIFDATHQEFVVLHNKRYETAGGFPNVNKRGYSTQRPANLEIKDFGFQYYDRTLHSTITWDTDAFYDFKGDLVIDSTGTSVNRYSLIAFESQQYNDSDIQNIGEYVDGHYVNGQNGTIEKDAALGYFKVDISGKSSVTFLGFVTPWASLAYGGYEFLDENNGVLQYGHYAGETGVYDLREYTVNVPQNAKWFLFNCRYDRMAALLTLKNKFYCFADNIPYHCNNILRYKNELWTECVIGNPAALDKVLSYSELSSYSTSVYNNMQVYCTDIKCKIKNVNGIWKYIDFDFGNINRGSSDRPNIYSSVNVQDGFGYYDTTLSELIHFDKEDKIWKDSNNNNILDGNGTTNERPSSDVIWIGYQYNDTTLNKLIIWNGSKWINTDGTDV